MLLRPIAIGQDRRQTLAILHREKRADSLCHAGTIAQTQANMKLLNASVH